MAKNKFTKAKWKRFFKDVLKISKSIEFDECTGNPLPITVGCITYTVFDMDETIHVQMNTFGKISYLYFKADTFECDYKRDIEDEIALETQIREDLLTSLHDIFEILDKNDRLNLKEIEKVFEKESKRRKI